MNEKAFLARNTRTGNYWGGPKTGFNATRDAAVAVNSPELAVIRASFLNVETIELPRLGLAEEAFLKSCYVAQLLTRKEALSLAKESLVKNNAAHRGSEAAQRVLNTLIDRRDLRLQVIGRRSVGYCVLSGKRN